MLVAIVSQNSFVFLWGIAQFSRHKLQNGVSHKCACVKISANWVFGEGVDSARGVTVAIVRAMVHATQ